MYLVSFNYGRYVLDIPSALVVDTLWPAVRKKKRRALWYKDPVENHVKMGTLGIDFQHCSV